MTRKDAIEFIKRVDSTNQITQEDMAFLIDYADFRGEKVDFQTLNLILRKKNPKKVFEFVKNWLSLHYKINIVIKDNKIIKYY